MPLRTLLAAVALATCMFAADPHDPNEIRNAAQRVSRNLAVQSQLPDRSGAADVPVERIPEISGGSDSISIPAPAAVLNLLQWVLIAIAAVAVIALLVILLREPLAARRRPKLPQPGPEADAPPPPGDPRELLARADRLAAEGRYPEAMHCVLLAATTMLGGKASLSADSLTSWELLRNVALAPPQLHALRDLVLRVERAWFGQRPAGLDDYRQVRGRFDEFAAAGETA